MDAIKEQKKLTIIKAASDLFRKYGYKKVSIQEICKEACVSKTTFYKAFEDKASIAKLIISKTAKEIKFNISESCLKSHGVKEKVEELLALHDQFMDEIGYDFLSETMSVSEEISQCLSKVFVNFERNLTKSIRLGQKTGEVSKEVNINFALCLLKKLHQLEADSDFVEILPDVTERSNQLSYIFFNGVLKRL